MAPPDDQDRILQQMYDRDMEEASAASLKDNPRCVSVKTVKELGVKFANEVGIPCRASKVNIKPDGNCCMRAAALSLDPSLAGEDLDQAGHEIRVSAVGSAIELLDTMTADELEHLQAIASQETEVIFSKQEIKGMLKAFLDSGKWNGALGDVIPQIVACSILRPIIIVEITDGRAKSANIMIPGRLFNMGDAPENVVPLVFFRQHNHFEVGEVTDKERAAERKERGNITN